MKELLDHAHRHADDILETLRQIVEMESFSSDKSSVDALGEYLRERLEALGSRVRVERQPEAGNHVVAEWGEGEDDGDGREQTLILCHMDTVWPPGTLQEKPFRVEDGLAYGPGVLDMKAGIAITIHALEALNALGLVPTQRVKMVFNSDEEMGSTTSRELIE